MAANIDVVITFLILTLLSVATARDIFRLRQKRHGGDSSGHQGGGGVVGIGSDWGSPFQSQYRPQFGGSFGSQYRPEYGGFGRPARRRRPFRLFGGFRRPSAFFGGHRRRPFDQHHTIGQQLSHSIGGSLGLPHSLVHLIGHGIDGLAADRFGDHHGDDHHDDDDHHGYDSHDQHGYDSHDQHDYQDYGAGAAGVFLPSGGRRF